MKKIFMGIVVYIGMIIAKTAIHKYGLKNADNGELVVVTYLLSVSLSIIFFVILNKLFFKKSKI